MKKRNVLAAAFITLILATGCSAQGGTTSSAAPTQAVSTSAAKAEVETTVPETTVETEKMSDETGDRKSVV